MTVSPYLFFDGTCREAMTAYADIFGAETAAMMTYAELPEGEEAPEGGEDRIMHAAIRFPDGAWIMASDDLPGRHVAPAATHVMVMLPDVAAARAAFDRLADGGAVKVPFAPTFWSPGFGAVVDRWGTPWMIGTDSPTG